jgi:hypothetical protein
MKRTVVWISLLWVLAVLTPDSQSQAARPSSGRNILVDFKLPQKNASQEVLASSTLRVRLNGQDIRVTKSERVTIKPRIVILLDQSASMGGDTHIWNASIDLVTSAYSNLKSSGELFFLAFSDEKQPLEIHSFTEDFAHELQTKKIALNAKQNPTKGHTAARDAIVYAIRNLNLKLGDALLFISDGGENSSRTSEKETESILSRSGLRIFSLGIGNIGSPEELAGPARLRRLSLLTGGMAKQVAYEVNRMSLYSRVVLEPDEMAQLTEYIAWRITHPVVLTLDLPESAYGKLQVDAVDASGKRLKEIPVMAPERIEDISIQRPRQ